MAESKLNQLTLNEAAVKAALRDYYVKVLEGIEDQLIDILKQEVMVTMHGDGPGKPAWREELRDSMTELLREIATDYIELGAGAPALLGRKGRAKKVRAMIIAVGGGSAVGNPFIAAGPSGRSVWDDDITGKKPSAAKSEYALPEQFNQVGNFFIENAAQRIAVRAANALDEASANIPDSIFSKNIYTQ